MNNPKVLRKLIGFIIVMCLAILPSVVNAATMTPSLYFGITELRESGMGYSIGDPGANRTTGEAAKIWNIVQYSGPSATGYTETNVYCIKAGVGFTEGAGTDEIQEYDVKYNKTVIVIGNEAKGVSENIQKIADQKIKLLVPKKYAIHGQILQNN